MLPTSRLEALSVVVANFFGAMLSETPREDKPFAIALTGLTNLWALTSSILTAIDMFSDDSNVEAHLWRFMMGVVTLTIVTSSCAVVTLVPLDDCRAFLGWIGGLATFAALPFGLFELYLSYSVGCAQATDSVVAGFCEHSTVHVLTVLIGAGFAALVVCLVIRAVSLDPQDCRCVLVYLIIHHDHIVVLRDHKQSAVAAALNRSSAFVKLCLFGAYWYLVDADLSWGTTIIDSSCWWVSGQWAKHGAAFANIFLNHY